MLEKNVHSSLHKVYLFSRIDQLKNLLDESSSSSDEGKADRKVKKKKKKVLLYNFFLRFLERKKCVY